MRGGVKIVNSVGDGVANLVGNLGADLVDIQTESMVHWRLAFMTTGTIQGRKRSKGMSKSEMGLWNRLLQL